MNQPYFIHEQIPLLAELDVLVVGGGSAGCCAAIAAAEGGRRQGIRVGLIERYGFAGGISTQTLDTFYGFFTPGTVPRKVVGGVPDRIVAQLARSNDVFLRQNTYGAGMGVTYNPERLKLIWDQLLSAAGVQLWLHATLVDGEINSSGRPMAAIISSKEGFHKITAKRMIDASGDADLCRWLGIAFEKAGEVDPAQTLTTTFRMCNVDLAKFQSHGGKKMLAEKMEQAVVSGSHLLPRKSGSAHPMVHENCIATVAVRVADIDATKVEQLTLAEQEGRRQAFIYEDFLREMVAGYENAKIIGLSHQIGVRETRRVYGEYRLTREDCLSARQFDDAVLLCGAPIEDHSMHGNGQLETHWEYLDDQQAYGVPYRTLVPKGSDEVWVAGRCFSATHDAHASCRSMAQTMSMGQAAGLAAVQSLQQDCSARDVNTSQLRDSLAEIGAVLEIGSQRQQAASSTWKFGECEVATA